MKHYFLHDELGRISQTGVCADGDLAHQGAAGMFLKEGIARHGLDYFDGIVVAPMPTQPSIHHAFNYASKQWEDLRTLLDHQAAKWLRIKQARESAINSPLATPYGTFDAHAKARASITDAVLLLQTLSAQGTPQTIDWTLADNTAVTLTTAQMVEVGVLLVQQVQAAYTQARSLRLQIDAATTLQEVALVAWV